MREREREEKWLKRIVIKNKNKKVINNIGPINLTDSFKVRNMLSTLMI